MADLTLNTTEVFEVRMCPECGTQYALIKTFIEEKAEVGGTWYCPNGHPRVFRTTDAERLRKEVQRERARADQADARANHANNFRKQTERQLAATKGVVTRIKNRVSKGICPCCKRTFADLARHMNTKHPGYGDDK